GMNAEDIESTNARLADPPDLDVSVTRRMGLYVVARLAKRHEISVQLRPNDAGSGLIARITVPARLVQPGGLPAPTLPSSLHPGPAVGRSVRPDPAARGDALLGGPVPAKGPARLGAARGVGSRT